MKQIHDLRDDVGDKIRRLESINERLELFDEPESQPPRESAPREVRARATGGDTIFVVHGHDDAHKQELARFLSRLTSLKVVILHEQPHKGRTIIEKFEDYASQAAFAIATYRGRRGASER